MKLDFKKGNGLVPVIVQNYKTNEVLMLGYINNEALKRTLKTGWVWFWSRSREELWLKGKNSGNKLIVRDIFVDCDKDTILVKVDFKGQGVCHTGNRTCFEKSCIIKK